MTFWQSWCAVWFVLAWSAAFLAWRILSMYRRAMADRKWFLDAVKEQGEFGQPNWSEILERQKASRAERDSLVRQAKALRTALIFIVGYVSRLEDEIRLQFASGRSRDLLDTAPPIMGMVESINIHDWATFDKVAHGGGIKTNDRG